MIRTDGPACNQVLTDKNERGRLNYFKTASFVFVREDWTHAGPCVQIMRLFTWAHAFDLLLYFG